MNIGIIGTGVVGSSLGKGLAARGHAVMFSSREPDSAKMQALLAEVGASARAGTVAETLAFGEVIVVAMGWDKLPQAIEGAGDWSGKVVIDATNRFGPPPAGSKGSAAQDLAAMTGARVVKAFNTIGAELMVDPPFAEKPAMFISGDDAAAKTIVTQLTGSLGFEVVDVGPLSSADLLENLARLWVTLARTQGRGIAFRLLRT